MDHPQTRGRPESRITPTLAAIEAAWRQHPDWRLGQLIFNLTGGKPFNVEDDELVAEATDLVSRG